MAIKTSKTSINFVYVALGVILFIGVMLFITGRLGDRQNSTNGAGARVIQDGQVNFETVLKSQISSYKGKVYFTISSQEEWQKVWGEINSGSTPVPALPAVDFTKEMLVLVFQGNQSTGGYSVEVTGVEKKDGVVGVMVKEISPGAGCMTTQVLTAPSHIVKIPKVDAKFEYDIKYERTECGR